MATSVCAYMEGGTVDIGDGSVQTGAPTDVTAAKPGVCSVTQPAVSIVPNKRVNGKVLPRE